MQTDGGSSGGGASRRWRLRGSEGVAAGASSISALGTDILCAIFARLDHFDIIRCAAACKSWHNIICSSTLLRDIYVQRGPVTFNTSHLPISSGLSLSAYLEELAMEQHRLALLNGHAEIHQWNCHSVGVSKCRMKRGLILTGGGDKIVRLWSAANYQRLGEYSFPGMNSLIDLDFDESKVVGLLGSQICIWRRSGKASILKSKEGSFARSICMRYIDPEAVIGCGDGRSRVFDMYSGSCQRVIRMHSGPVTCLSLTDEQLIFGGSSFGVISVADLSSGEKIASLKSSISPIGISSLCYNTNSHMVFAGSTAGYSHCWDLRMLRPVWEWRVSPNIIYAVDHLPNDTSMLAIGGINGVLRILSQQTGKVVCSYVTSGDYAATSRQGDNEVIKKCKAKFLSENAQIDGIPKRERPSITCLAVGMRKIVTAHNEKHIRLWRFSEQEKV